MRVLGQLVLASVAVATLEVPAVSAQNIQVDEARISFFDPVGMLPSLEAVETVFFDAERSGQIGFRLTLHHDNAERFDVILPVYCVYIGSDSTRTGPIRIDYRIPPTQIRSEQSWTVDWDPTKNLPGAYQVQCSGDGDVLVERTFQMASLAAIAGVRTALSNPRFPPSDAEVVKSLAVRVTQMRLFPAGSELPPSGERQYTSRFSAGQTAHIAVELEIEHTQSEEAIEIPFACIYSLIGGQATEAFRFSYEAGQITLALRQHGYAAKGIGWDEPGHWPPGDYVAVCGIHGRPVAIEYFSVVP